MAQLRRAREEWSANVAYSYDNDRDDSKIALVINGSARSFRSVEAAYLAFHSAVAAKLKEGFVPMLDGLEVQAPAPTQFAELPELEALVDEGSHPDAMAVLTDAWVQANDPRGLCISLAKGLQKQSDPEQFMQRKRAGEAARRARNNHLLYPLGADAYRVKVTLSMGLVEKVTLEDEQLAPGRTTQQLLEAVVKSRFCRFLKEIQLINTPVLNEMPPHPALRKLGLWGEEPWPLSSFATAYPRLESLDLSAPLEWSTPAPNALSRLKNFVLHSHLVNDVAEVLNWLSSLEHLETLTLWARTPSEGAALVAAWANDVSQWPPRLQQLTVSGQVRTRSLDDQ